MDTIEIFLNKLYAGKELYAELSSKLECGSISGKNELSAVLSEWNKDIGFKLFISDENISNEIVDEIIEVFDECKNINCETVTDEFLNVIEENERITHLSKPRSLIHRDGNLHPTVHVWIVKRKDMGIFVLLQKRASGKEIYPDCYDVSAAGHVSQGMEFRKTAVKEAYEELGLEIPAGKLEHIGNRQSSHSNGEINDNEMSAVYIYRENVDINNLVLQHSEVSEVCWAEIDEVLAAMKNEDFPNCISIDELAMIKKALF